MNPPTFNPNEKQMDRLDAEARQARYENELAVSVHALPTPQTDAGAYYIDGHYYISAELGRKLERALVAAKLDCGHAEKRCDAALASWDEERDRALREGDRVIKLKALLYRIRNEPALLKGGAGGQDQYAGLPSCHRLIDSALSMTSDSDLHPDLHPDL